MGLNLVGLNVVSDSDRADELSAFYERLLGWTRFLGDEFTALCKIEQKGFPTWITSRQVGDYVRPVWPATPEEQQMAHLDFHVKDVGETVNYALSCGATVSETQCDDGRQASVLPTAADVLDARGLRPLRLIEYGKRAMKEKSMESSRGRIFYWTEKAAAGVESLVFLPGLTADHRLFECQLPHFAKNYNVLVWDAPAHGKSRPYLDFSYSHLAEELKAVLDAEGIGRAVLVGQSAGGFVAQSFIARYPTMVMGLFTIGTCPYGTTYYSGSDLFWLKQTKWMFNCFPDRLLRSSIAKMCSVTPAGRENMLRMLGSYEKEELCRLMYLGFAGFIPEMQDLNISCPVCLTVGAEDGTGKVRAYNQRWHEKEGYPLHIIKGASHNANYDQPEEMNRLLETFIQRLSTR